MGPCFVYKMVIAVQSLESCQLFATPKGEVGMEVGLVKGQPCLEAHKVSPPRCFISGDCTSKGFDGKYLKPLRLACLWEKRTNHSLFLQHLE